MKHLNALTQARFDGRTNLALGLLLLDGMVVSVFTVMGGRSRAPGIELFVLAQGLLLPVLVGSVYSTYLENPSLVPYIGVMPVGGALLPYVLVTLDSGVVGLLELLWVLASVSVFMIAVSGVWTILGYATGTVARWRRQDSFSDRQLRAAGRQVLLASAIITPTYLLAIWIWLLQWNDIVVI